MVLIFVSYVSYIWAKYGIQPSISQSYYALPENKRILFTLFCWGFAIPAIILGSNFLMFIAGAGIGFVGAAAQIRRKLDHQVHNIGAAVAVLASQASIFFDYHLWIISVISLALFILLPFIDRKHYIWLIELVAFTAICITFGLGIF